MHKMLLSLETLAERLPNIKQALDPQRWSTLVKQLDAQAPSFAALAESVTRPETDLGAAERKLESVLQELLGHLLQDETVAEILTRPRSSTRSAHRLYLNERDPVEAVALQTIANHFYTLSHYTEQIAAGTPLLEIQAGSGADRPASSPPSDTLPKRMRGV